MYGQLIFNLRKYLGLSTLDFAKKLGVDPATLFRYENENNASDKVIDYICNIFNVNKDYFCNSLSIEEAVERTGDNHMRVERIKILMKEKGINTNKELSILSKISTTRLSVIFREEAPLNSDKAKKIADALNVGVDYILYGDESKKTYPVNDVLIEWLWSHPEIRKEIWDKIHTNSND